MTVTSLRRTPRARPQVLRQALQEHTRAAYREAILAAAEKIILRDGYQPAKMADIAESTGVSVGTLYNYFDSKEAVFNALYEHHRNRFLAHVEQPFDSDDPLEQLRQFVTRSHEFVEHNGALFNLYVRERVAEIDSPIEEPGCVVPAEEQKRFGGHLENMLKMAQDANKIRNDLPLEDLVWALQSLLQSLLLDWCRRPSQVPLKQRGQEVVTLFLQGACTR
jgi:AcrR family transcriptional regulator